MKVINLPLTHIMEHVAPVAQGIEHFSPKEGVGRSNRLGGTLGMSSSRNREDGIFIGWFGVNGASRIRR